jgi:O-antigen/teichoic acid export membrane protein
MNKIKSLFTKSNYLKSILTLMTGTTAAQIIPILASPFLTRIYEPKDFGELALYVSIVITSAIVATGRFEQAVILPEKNDDSFKLVTLTTFLALAFSIFIFLVIEICKVLYKERLQKLGLIDWISFVPISVFLIAVNQSLYYWLNRQENYRSITVFRVLNSSAMTVSQLLLSTVVENGLLVGYVIGQLFSALFLVKEVFSTTEYQLIAKSLTIKGLQEQAIRYSKFPKFLMIGHVMNSLSGNMPVLLLANFFDVNTQGFYALTFRVVSTPLSLFGLAIADIFREKSSKEFSTQGKCDKTFVKTFKLLLFISILPAIGFFFAAPSVFSILFGDNWSTSGVYAQLLMPMFFVQFITIPLCSMFIIAEKQELDLAWQIVRMFLSVVTIFIGYKYYNSDIASVLMFSLAFAGLYAASGFMSYRFSLGK